MLGLTARLQGFITAHESTAADTPLPPGIAADVNGVATGKAATRPGI
jgi:hypothetical protein